jgi:hypothetical protein
MRHLIVDGMLNGTGIREAGCEYIPLNILDLSPNFQSKIKNWLLQYETEFYHGYPDNDKIELLDKQGLEITHELEKIFPEDKIEYYSDALLMSLTHP